MINGVEEKPVATSQESTPVQESFQPAAQPTTLEEPLQEPFVDKVSEEVVAPAETPHDFATLPRDNAAQVTTPLTSTNEPNMQYAVPQMDVSTKKHHWYQWIILVILILVVLGLILLVLHALNVYDALSIDTPVLIDNALIWIQGLVGK